MAAKLALLASGASRGPARSRPHGQRRPLQQPRFPLPRPLPGPSGQPRDPDLDIGALALDQWEGLLSGDALKAPAIDNALLVSLADAGWEAHLSPKWAGATLGDAAKLMGVLNDATNEHVLEAREFTQAELDAVPTEFDWRTDPRAAKCPSLKEIRDQANCGSCWAFGSTEAMTDRMCIASNGTVTTHLSAQDVTSCDKLGDMGCSGGIPSSVYSYWALSGIVDGGNYGDKSGCWSYQLEPCAHHVNSSKYPACPDEVRAPKCARKCESEDKDWTKAKVKGEKGYSVCQQGELEGTCAVKMAADIYQNGPITGMFFVKQDFLAYKSGVYEPKLLSPPLGGHAIKIMGFGTEDGKDYWLVANSWNEDWGDDGYFKIIRGKNACQIEDPVINGGPVAGHPKSA